MVLTVAGKDGDGGSEALAAAVSLLSSAVGANGLGGAAMAAILAAVMKGTGKKDAEGDEEDAKGDDEGAEEDEVGSPAEETDEEGVKDGGGGNLEKPGGAAVCV